MNIILKDFGDRVADDIKPSEIAHSISLNSKTALALWTNSLTQVRVPRLLVPSFSCLPPL
jgi:hypothetical protein